MIDHFDNEPDSIVIERLKSLRVETPRDPCQAAAGRENYLAQVKVLTSEKRNNLPVSRLSFLSLNGWIDTIKKTRTRKEHFNMIAAISTWIVIVIMLFGGTGATVLAAQESLPTDFLYPVKTLGEEMHLALSPDPQVRADLLYRCSERRMDEILQMLRKGQPLADEWAKRWQEQFSLALQATAQLDEPALIRALEQARSRLRIQEGRLQATQSNQSDDPGGAVERLRAQLRNQQQLVDGALDNPAAFRLRWRERQQGSDQNSETLPPSGQGNGSGLGPGPRSTPPCDTCTPALDGTGPGPGPQRTPVCDTCAPVMDGTGPGPGPQGTLPCDACTPALDGTGPGPGPQSSPACDTCTPALDGTGPGPGPEHQGGDNQPGQPSEGESDSGKSGGSGGGSDNGGPGGGCDSCGNGGGGHRP